MVRKQHYIPQMYLKRFESADGLCVYDMEKGQVRYQQNYEDYAHRNYFYDLPSKELLPIILEYIPGITKEKAESLSKQQFIEKGLCRIEGHAEKTLDDLTEGRALITDRAVQNILIVFLQVLSLRTPAHRKNIEKIHRGTAEWLSEVSIPKEQYGDYLKKVSESTSENYSKAEQIRNLLDPNTCFEFSCMLLDRYDWYMGTVAPESSLSLIISDNPALMIALGLMTIAFQFHLKKQ